MVRCCVDHKPNEISLMTDVGGAELELFIEFLHAREGDPYPLDQRSIVKLLQFLRDCQAVLRIPDRKRTQKISEAEKSMFLLAMERTGNAIRSARICGRSRQRLYQLKLVDEEFKARWDEALLMFQANLVEEARRRGQVGVVEPVFQKGEQVGEKRAYSDHLLMAMLKKFAGFGDKVVGGEETGVVIMPGIQDSVEEWEAAFVDEVSP